MPNEVIISLVVVLAVALAIFINRHRHHFDFTPEKLSEQVECIFAHAEGKRVSKEDFLHQLKHNLSCTSKEANMLLGKARELRMVEVAGEDVVKK